MYGFKWCLLIVWFGGGGCALPPGSAGSNAAGEPAPADELLGMKCSPCDSSVNTAGWWLALSYCFILHRGFC